MYGWPWRAKLAVIVPAGEPSECWRADPAKCSIDNDGYAHFQATDTAEHLVHRAAVIADGRDIPAGYEVDHIAEVCSYRDCGNPAHLVVVTHPENAQLAWALHVVAPVFPCGHDRASNAFPRSRGCRTCSRERARLRKSIPPAYWRVACSDPRPRPARE